ncbi:saccharopine dehydrogenase family protein [Gracilimonas sp.]|uniref:saccharopine dehydrogenase family protein n=1 Tax=Gracilimonas sp. TaxID=1974203 RepID=UPI0028729968|nr:saccharopine dehydrogenase NADP-binding domain-containing protein [Gracilimonas sp.]
MEDKKFDLILIGATGFTGKRAARYLSNHAPKDLKWGIAARNEHKLQKVAGLLDITADRCFIVDTTEKSQVEDVVSQSKIIMTTVGPFSLYGENVIAACAKFGTHYLDITGEVGFIKKMKEKYGETAQQNGAKIIPFSGFDSVPADISAYLLSQEFNNPDKLTLTSYYSISGGFNGGTIATMLHKFESGEYKEMSNPALLLDDSSLQIHKPEYQNFFGYNRKIHRWTAPFIMSAINSKVVYKSASLIQKNSSPYAKSISYNEQMSLGKWYNPLPFFVVSLILLSINLLGPYGWFRSILRKIMPAPGEGPSEQEIEHGFFKMHTFAIDSEGTEKSLKVYYPGDPGNKSTVFFLCESALLLALNPDKFSSGSGFLTPVAAFGNHLVDHLQSRGLNLERIT